MGRVFVIELEGPAYTCIECHTHIGVPSDIISKEIEEVFDIHDNDIIYDFSRLFNTFLAENTFYSALQMISSLRMVVTNMSSLDSSIHFWLKERSKISFVSFVPMRSAFNYGVTDPNSYWVMRGELHGPEGSDDEI
ncbi:hypothetical protein Bca101_051575 [Brassica carinata]